MEIPEIGIRQINIAEVYIPEIHKKAYTDQFGSFHDSKLTPMN